MKGYRIVSEDPLVVEEIFTQKILEPNDEYWEIQKWLDESIKPKFLKNGKKVIPLI